LGFFVEFFFGFSFFIFLNICQVQFFFSRKFNSSTIFFFFSFFLLQIFFLVFFISDFRRSRKFFFCLETFLLAKRGAALFRGKNWEERGSRGRRQNDFAGIIVFRARGTTNFFFSFLADLFCSRQPPHRGRGFLGDFAPRPCRRKPTGLPSTAWQKNGRRRTKTPSRQRLSVAAEIG